MSAKKNTNIIEVDVNKKVQNRLISLFNQMKGIEVEMQSEVNLILDVKEVESENCHVSLNDDFSKIVLQKQKHSKTETKNNSNPETETELEKPTLKLEKKEDVEEVDITAED